MISRHRKYTRIYCDPETFGCLRAILYSFPFIVFFWFILIAVVLYYSESEAANPDQSQTTIGHDFLALQHPKFPYKKISKYVKYPSALGVLDFTFGESLDSVDYLLATGKFKYLRVHLINGSCIRLGNCGSYYPFVGYSVQSFERAARRGSERLKTFIKSRTSLYCELAYKYPDTQLLISPVLEHNLSRKSWQNMASLIKWQCPIAQPVNSSMVGIKYSNTINERHGHPWKGVTDIYSLDGLGLDYVDLTDLVTKHKITIFFIWEGLYNCRVPGPFVDPRDRETCVSARRVRYLEQRFKEAYASSKK